MSKKRQPPREAATSSGVTKRSYTLPNGKEVDVWNRLRKNKEAIAHRVREIGKRLYHDITEERKLSSVTVVSVLTGGLVFTADLLRALNDQEHDRGLLTVRVEVIKARKYQGRKPRPLKLGSSLLDPNSVRGKHLLLVDDIVDSGETLRTVYKKLMLLGADTVTPVVLLVKRDQQKGEFGIDLDPTLSRVSIADDSIAEECRMMGYVGFAIDSMFVVGYGMDYLGAFRDLSYLGTIDPPSDPPQV
jgi:hypoxanthine phosphoribosyltransferase